MRFERSRTVFRRIAAAVTGARSVAPDYAGGEAVMVSADGQVVPEFLPQNWLRGTRALRQGALEHILHRGLDIFASLTLLLLTSAAAAGGRAGHQARSARADSFTARNAWAAPSRSFHILKFRSMTVDAEKPGIGGLGRTWATAG